MARAAIAGHGLLGRFSYLLASQVVLVITGLGYWAITTRLYPARDIGVAAAAVSMSVLLSSVGVLGITSIMLVVLNDIDPSERRAVVTTGAAIACGVVAVLCAGSIALSPWLGPSMRLIGASPIESLLYVLSAIVLTAGMIADNAAIGIRRAPAQFARNAVQAVLRLVIVVIAAITIDDRSSVVLLLAWFVSICVSLSVVPLLRLQKGPHYRLADRWRFVQQLGALSLRHHVLNLAITSISFLLPATAALLVVPRLLAYFSVAQQMAASALLPPALLAMTLFAETTGDEERLRHSIRRTLPVGFGCCFLVLAIGEPFAPQILGIFGHPYATHSLTPLRLLLLAGVPYVLKDHYVAIRRAQQRLTEAARLIACATASEIAGAAIGGAIGGIDGLCLGWIVVCGAEALLFAAPVAQIARRERHPSAEDVLADSAGVAALSRRLRRIADHKVPS